MKKLILVLMVLVMSSAVFANGEEICRYFTEEKGIVANEYSVPKFIPYKNDVINAYTNEGDVVGHITIEDKVITSIGCNLTENPDFVINVKDLETVKNIFAAESKADAIDDALQNKDVIIKGQSMGKSVKGFFTRVGIKIASWFS